MVTLILTFFSLYCICEKMLKLPQGEFIEEPKTIIEKFWEFFSCPSFDDFPRLSDKTAALLIAAVTNGEVWYIIIYMNSNCFPNADGITSFYFECFCLLWSIVKRDVCATVAKFFCSLLMPSHWKETLVILIHKKVVAKVFVHRLLTHTLRKMQKEVKSATQATSDELNAFLKSCAVAIGTSNLLKMDPLAVKSSKNSRNRRPTLENVARHYPNDFICERREICNEHTIPLTRDNRMQDDCNECHCLFMNRMLKFEEFEINATCTHSMPLNCKQTHQTPASDNDRYAMSVKNSLQTYTESMHINVRTFVWSRTIWCKANTSILYELRRLIYIDSLLTGNCKRQHSTKLSRHDSSPARSNKRPVVHRYDPPTDNVGKSMLGIFHLYAIGIMQIHHSIYKVRHVLATHCINMQSASCIYTLQHTKCIIHIIQDANTHANLHVYMQMHKYTCEYVNMWMKV
ncbi:hypothetical protein M5K25_019638 [Dendrobium thyrsiflorum]|uniref:Uncharacterized protein n=1 Tax=Dendrobium thyrsiflorum TaxID=117978 RepID=A0ABD0UFI9_DENTH